MDSLVIGDSVNERLYVPTDSKGVEHAAAGHIIWHLPIGDDVVVTRVGRALVLRQPEALLDVLDEQIYLAESLDDVKVSVDGTAVVQAARLVVQTRWDTETATRFALDCADYTLNETGDVSLPDGTFLSKVVSEARQVLDGIVSGNSDRLSYLARVHALRRLRHERTEVADLSLGLLTADEALDIDALDDPAYATVIPITDCVLVAIEALRHHVLPKPYMDIEDAREEREEHENLDSQRSVSGPKVVFTGFGTLVSGSPFLPYEPAWTAAREAARHVCLAAKDRQGEVGEANERARQATLLASILE